ncbi:glutathione S-transferase [Aspergillus pseudoustus]|uniref:Glutathione S-transferase n=1 Tax=Aspergillus pseudoustus TaxID=1810923 RepID=A0ABR4IU32_9EURO
MPLKPITLYSHAGPNGWKVAFILEELGLPYTTKFIPFSVVRKEPYISINPNGRVPAIEDPNTNTTLWESGAILEYLVETYDRQEGNKERKISFAPGTPEYFEAKQWLHFQTSGQGPYFGQAVWFTVYHPEKLPSARERYIKEVRRVSGVLDGVLASRQYLVGGRFSYVDAAFITWFSVIPQFLSDAIDVERDFPNVSVWLGRLQSRPAIAKVVKERADVVASQFS